MGKVYHDIDGQHSGDWEAVENWITLAIFLVLTGIIALGMYGMHLLFGFLKAKGWL